MTSIFCFRFVLVFFVDEKSFDEALEATEGADIVDAAIEALDDDGGIDDEEVDKEANPLETLERAVEGGMADEVIDAASSMLPLPVLEGRILKAV